MATNDTEQAVPQAQDTTAPLNDESDSSGCPATHSSVSKTVVDPQTPAEDKAALKGLQRKMSFSDASVEGSLTPRSQVSSPESVAVDQCISDTEINKSVSVGTILSRLESVRKYLKEAEEIHKDLWTKSSEPNSNTQIDILIKELRDQETSYLNVLMDLLGQPKDRNRETKRETDSDELEDQDISLKAEMKEEYYDELQSLKEQEALLKKLVDQQKQLQDLEARQVALLELKRSAEDKLSVADRGVEGVEHTALLKKVAELEAHKSRIDKLLLFLNGQDRSAAVEESKDQPHFRVDRHAPTSKGAHQQNAQSFKAVGFSAPTYEYLTSKEKSQALPTTGIHQQHLDLLQHQLTLTSKMCFEFMQGQNNLISLLCGHNNADAILRENFLTLHQYHDHLLKYHSQLQDAYHHVPSEASFANPEKKDDEVFHGYRIPSQVIHPPPLPPLYHCNIIPLQPILGFQTANLGRNELPHNASSQFNFSRPVSFKSSCPNPQQQPSSPQFNSPSSTELNGTNHSTPEVPTMASSTTEKRAESPSNLSMSGTSFDTLRETIYSEVATLIAYNESRPHFLVELFRELQLLNTDYLRQRVLYSIQDIITTFLADNSSVEEHTPSESIDTCTSEEHDKNTDQENPCNKKPFPDGENVDSANPGVQVNHTEVFGEMISKDISQAYKEQ